MFLLAALLPACTGLYYIERCEVLDQTPVDDDDAALGFSVAEMVGLVDGQTWDADWQFRDAGLADPALATFRTTVTRTSMPAWIQESADADTECPTAGTFLYAPVDLTVANDAGTLVVSARGYVAANQLDVALILFETDDTWATLESAPANLVDLAEAAAFEKHPTTTEWALEVSAGGTGATLGMNFQINGSAPDIGYGMSFATATLTAR